jgi:hypothetical protein
MLQGEPRAVDLPLVRCAAQLLDQLEALGKTRRTERMTLAQ